jgi:23S rRNA (uracil1939-C5)-methyltransferase
MSRKRKLKPKRYELEIEALSHEGRGITHLDKKVIFVSGALSGEKVVAERVFSRAKFEEAEVLEVLKHADNRIEPCSFLPPNILLIVPYADNPMLALAKV